MSEVRQQVGGERAAGPRRGVFGISAALTTPFRQDLSVDLDALAGHAAALIEEGCASVTLFGTTGEGVSLGREERAAAQRALLDAGIGPQRLVVGLTACSVDAAVEQAEQAIADGIGTLLVPPPYYFKDVSDDGLYSWFSSLLERVAAKPPRIILYHIPQVTGVGLSLPLVRRLRDNWPGMVFGVKDSSGHWPTTEAFLAQSDLAVLVGDERHLAAAAREGAAGAISGLANVVSALLAELVRSGQDDTRIHALVGALVKLPVTPAVKALVGIKRGDRAWSRVRAPLEPTPADEVERLERLLEGFFKKRAA